MSFLLPGLVPISGEEQGPPPATARSPGLDPFLLSPWEALRVFIYISSSFQIDLHLRASATMCCWGCVITLLVLVVVVVGGGLVLGLVHNTDGDSLWDQFVSWFDSLIKS